jgi:hypothetical protein
LAKKSKNKLESANISIGGKVGPGAAVGQDASVEAWIIAGGNVHFNVPPPVPPDYPQHFVGREKNLQELRKLLSQNYEVPIVTMTGLPGIGKTTLATVAAHQLAYVFRDGCLWANMGEYTGRPVALLKRFIAHYWQESPDINEPDGLAELLRSILVSKRVLIVLDHVEDTADLKYIKKLVGASRSTLLVVTNRKAVTQHLATPIYELSSLTDEDALLLLAQQTDNQLDPEDENIVRLLRRTRKHPATLIQLAVQIRHYPGKEPATWVESLEGIPLAFVDTEAFAAAVYRHTYELLSVEQQRLFRLLGILGQIPYRADALAAILGFPKEKVIADLGILADVSLLSNRNSIEPLPHMFAQTTARASQDYENLWQETHRYYLHWFTGFAEAEQLQDEEDELKHIRFLYSRVVEQHDWDMMKLYRKTLSAHLLDSLDITVQGKGLVYGVDSSIPFPAFSLYTEQGTIAKINLQGGSGSNLFCNGGMLSHLQLAGASFGNIYVERGVFANCDLRGAEFGNITILSGAFLNCNLRGATFGNIYVESGMFANCDLRETDWGNLSLVNSKATDINVRGARLGDIRLDHQSVFTEIKWQGAETGTIDVQGILTSPEGLEQTTGINEPSE